MANTQLALAGGEDSVTFRFITSSSIAHVTLNRPYALNAINSALLTDLVKALKTVQTLDAKVCILSGSGTSFCAGEDLKETLAPRSGGKDPVELRRAFAQLQDVTRLIAGTETIFIASVQGWAVGGGAEIALAADLVIAGPQAMFRFPEVTHGHAPTGGITARLPQIVGLQQAKRLMLLGESISATAALSMNLVTELADDPLARSTELAQALSLRPKRSLGSIKQCLEIATFPNMEAALRSEIDAASWCFADPCSNEAFSKFRNRKTEANTNADSHTSSIHDSHEGGNSGQTLVSLLMNAAKRHGDRPFLRFGSRDISYSCFARGVALLAAGLQTSGVGPGDVVAGMMFNSEEMVRAWFAVMWIGAIWSPLHTDFRGASLHRALALVSPKIIIIDDCFVVHLPAEFSSKVFVHGSSSASFECFSSLKAPAPVQPSKLSPITTACLLLTSGSTGPSKACELSHTYFITVATALTTALRLKSEDVLYCPFPLCHADATSLTVIPALLLGATAAIARKFSASRWWDEIRETRSTVADFMGATLSILFKAPPHPADHDNPLRLMWGVPVPVWAETFERRFGVDVIEVYGSTETGLPVVQPVDHPRIVGSCGVALPGVQLKLVDDSGTEVPSGVVGEITILQEPYTRFTGYYRDPEATARAVRDGWFHSGDLGRLDAQGNLYFAGRKKHAIRRRGENISAFEVEEAVLLHPDVLECAAYGVPSDLSEEDVMVSVVRRLGSALSEQDVHDFASKTMARFQVPRYIEFVDALPRTPTGKAEIFKMQEKWANGGRSSVRDFDAFAAVVVKS